MNTRPIKPFDPDEAIKDWTVPMNAEKLGGQLGPKGAIAGGLQSLAFVVANQNQAKKRALQAAGINEATANIYAALPAALGEIADANLNGKVQQGIYQQLAKVPAKFQKEIRKILLDAENKTRADIEKKSKDLAQNIAYQSIQEMIGEYQEALLINDNDAAALIKSQILSKWGQLSSEKRNEVSKELRDLGYNDFVNDLKAAQTKKEKAAKEAQNKALKEYNKGDDIVVKMQTGDNISAYEFEKRKELAERAGKGLVFQKEWGQYLVARDKKIKELGGLTDDEITTIEKESMDIWNKIDSLLNKKEPVPADLKEQFWKSYSRLGSANRNQFDTKYMSIAGRQTTAEYTAEQEQQKEQQTTAKNIKKTEIRTRITNLTAEYERQLNEKNITGAESTLIRLNDEILELGKMGENTQSMTEAITTIDKEYRQSRTADQADKDNIAAMKKWSKINPKLDAAFASGDESEIVRLIKEAYALQDDMHDKNYEGVLDTIAEYEKLYAAKFRNAQQKIKEAKALKEKNIKIGQKQTEITDIIAQRYEYLVDGDMNNANLLEQSYNAVKEELDALGVNTQPYKTDWDKAGTDAANALRDSEINAAYNNALSDVESNALLISGKNNRDALSDSYISDIVKDLPVNEEIKKDFTKELQAAADRVFKDADAEILANQKDVKAKRQNEILADQEIILAALEDGKYPVQALNRIKSRVESYIKTYKEADFDFVKGIEKTLYKSTIYAEVDKYAESPESFYSNIEKLKSQPIFQSFIYQEYIDKLVTQFSPIVDYSYNNIQFTAATEQFQKNALYKRLQTNTVNQTESGKAVRRSDIINAMKDAIKGYPPEIQANIEALFKPYLPEEIAKTEPYKIGYELLQNEYGTPPAFSGPLATQRTRDRKLYLAKLLLNHYAMNTPIEDHTQEYFMSVSQQIIDDIELLNVSKINIYDDYQDAALQAYNLVKNVDRGLQTPTTQRLRQIAITMHFIFRENND